MALEIWRHYLCPICYIFSNKNANIHTALDLMGQVCIHHLKAPVPSPFLSLHKHHIRTHSSSLLAANNIELPLSPLPSHLCSSSLDVCAWHRRLRRENLTVFTVRQTSPTSPDLHQHYISRNIYRAT